jgi:asparagine N-glycosylation enzyme membrane subunit Stt3
MNRKMIRFVWPVFFNILLTVGAVLILANVINEEKSILHIVGASVGLSASIIFLLTSVVMFVLHMSGFDAFS